MMTELNERESQLLLRIARRAVEESVRHHHLPEIEEAGGALGEKAGAFVTLMRGGRLRACMGYIEPVKPLYLVVQECALSAALRDPRFRPVASEELPDLRIDVSVLSPLFDILPDQIQVGRHGLLVSLAARRGVLLPQVAVKWNWDGQRFLEETCQKADLPKDAWRHGARLQAFTAQILEESSDLAHSSDHAA